MNKQWLNVRFGVLIYVVFCVSHPVLGKALPSRFLDNTEWTLTTDDCHHEYVSSYELNI